MQIWRRTNQCLHLHWFLGIKVGHSLKLGKKVNVWTSPYLSLVLNIMIDAPMVRFQLELMYYFTYFSPSFHPTFIFFIPVGLSLLIQHFQRVLWVLKFLLSPCLDSWQLEFISLIILIVGFQNCVCCLVWAVYLGVMSSQDKMTQYINFSPH